MLLIQNKHSFVETIYFGYSQPAKIDLNKKSFPQQKTIQNFTIDAQGLKQEMKSSHARNGIFISCFSEPLGINSEVLNSLLLG